MDDPNSDVLHLVGPLEADQVDDPPLQSLLPEKQRLTMERNLAGKKQ
jgi:hypothetical protein